jgi:2,3-bisphosphoglycerate-dependent phosphoglycerate mutase
VPDLQAGGTVLVTAHGNSLRALVKHLDGIGDAEIAELNIPTGIPLVYQLDDDLRPVSSRYLDEEAARAAVEAVKNQGR